MIARHVFLKLKEMHADAAGRAEVVERMRGLSDIDGVVSVSVGTPADAGAAAAWDVGCTVMFDDLDAVAAYARDPAHRRLVDEFLAPRIEVIKAWNFEV